MLRFAPLIAIALLCAPVAARAQDGEPAASAEEDEESRKARARVAYEAGKTHYTVGEFEEALADFTEAYKLRPAPLLLFNLAQCQRQLKNHERATFFLEGYLRDAPTEDANREVAAELLIEERAALEAERAEAARAEAEAREQAEAETAAAEAQQDALTTAQEVETAAATSEAAAVSEGPIWTQWWLWTGIAAGVVVVAAAIGGTAAAVALSDDGVPDSSLGTVDLTGGA
jgi:tetratricopeptide (TPR) repeat protein